MSDRVAPWQQTRARHLYLAHFRVRFHELDPLGHVNNAVYLNYLEQTAIDHAAAEGYDAATLRERGGVFIARRHDITYLRPAVENDLLCVTTWPADMSGARAIRAYEITRLTLGANQSIPEDGLRDVTDQPVCGEVIVSARTEWAFVDPVTGRPRRIPIEVRDAFLVSSPE
jgi:acyl-CoA thioester hydrolase